MRACINVKCRAVGWTLIGLLLGTVPAAAQEAALERLNASPRHHEWVSVTDGDRSVETFVVYPETNAKTLAVVIIHENRGLNDWARSLADQVAEAGYIAVAPDLLSGKGPNGGKTSDFPDADAARNALYELDDDQITADLNAVVNYARSLDAANGTVAVAGFCWGGAQTFRYATNQPDIAAAFVFYGSAPDPATFPSIQCPVYGFYGENDARITSAVPEVDAAMKAAGKTFEPMVYEGGGHGFMRSGEEAAPGDPNHTARAKAWERWKAVLSDL